MTTHEQAKAPDTQYRRDVELLAAAFGYAAHYWLGRLRCLAIDEENRGRPSVRHGSCASHDHCNAGELMDSAFRSLHGRDPTTDDIDLVIAAWDKVKTAGFADSADGSAIALRAESYLDLDECPACRGPVSWSEEACAWLHDGSEVRPS